MSDIRYDSTVGTLAARYLLGQTIEDSFESEFPDAPAGLDIQEPQQFEDETLYSLLQMGIQRVGRSPDPHVTLEKDEEGLAYTMEYRSDAHAYVPEIFSDVVTDLEPVAFRGQIQEDAYKGFKRKVAEDSALSGGEPAGKGGQRHPNWYR